MFPLSYPHEKFLNAAEHLAVSPAPIQERLQQCTRTFSAIQSRDFDDYPEIKSVYDEAMRRLTVVKNDPLGSIPATTSQMTDDEASEVAQLIFKIHYLVDRVYHAK